MSTGLVILAGHRENTPSALKEALKKIIGKVNLLNPYKKEYIPKALLYLNWGTRFGNKAGEGVVCNHPMAVEYAINKLQCFRKLQAGKVPCIEFTTSSLEAEKWLADGRSVFGRTLLESSQGKGIVLWKSSDFERGRKEQPEGWKGCKVYTRNYPKRWEVRIHVFKDKVIHFQEKRRMGDDKIKALGREEGYKPDFWVRSYLNGWVFCHETLTVPEEVRKGAENVARAALEVLGLDFGALDILIGRDGKAIVCEVNTAPALEGESLAAYTRAIGKAFKEVGGKCK